MRRLGSVLWRSAALLLGWGALLAPLLAALDAPLARLAAAHPERARLAVEAGALASLAAASWAMASLVERRRFSSLGFARERAGRAALAGVVLGAGCLGLSLVPPAALGYVKPAAPGSPPWGPIAVAALALALNALTQELLFRGYLFQAVQREYGAGAAVLATSVLFTLAHLPAAGGAWLAAANVFLAGAAYGLARAATGNLWLPTSIHASWNVLLGPVLGLAVSGKDLGAAGWRVLELRGPDLAVGGAFGLEGGFPVTLAKAALATGVWMAYRETVQRGAPGSAG